MSKLELTRIFLFSQENTVLLKDIANSVKNHKNMYSLDGSYVFTLEGLDHISKESHGQYLQAVSADICYIIVEERAAL